MVLLVKDDLCRMKGAKGSRFAMPAPWGIEFEKDVVIVVDHQVLIIVGYDDLDRTFLLLGNWLRFNACLHFAVHEILHKSTNVIVSEFLVLVEREFLVLDCFLDGECWPFVDLKVQIPGVCTE